MEFGMNVFRVCKIENVELGMTDAKLP